MFASIRTVSSTLRQWLFALALAVLIFGPGRLALAAPETDAQARLHHNQAKIRSLGRSVVKLMLKVDNHLSYIGTGVYVQDGARLFLLTADHVPTIGGQL